MKLELAGKILRRSRRNKELSVKALAELAGVGMTSIHNLEKGYTDNFNLGTLKKIFDALNVSFDIAFDKKSEQLALAA